MATHPLSQAQALLSAERYRLKLEQGLLLLERRTLSKLADVEADELERAGTSWNELHIADELERVAGEPDAPRRIHVLADEKLGALPQASLSVFGTLTRRERRAIALVLEPQDFKDGAVLIKEGVPRDSFFIIVQGQVTCMQLRDHRVKSAPRRLSTHARPQRPGTRGPRCSARQGCASRRLNRSATMGPWRLAASSAAIRATQAPISRSHPTGPAWTRACSSETTC